jgi:hypothetical protein
MRHALRHARSDLLADAKRVFSRAILDRNEQRVSVVHDEASHTRLEMVAARGQVVHIADKHAEVVHASDERSIDAVTAALARRRMQARAHHGVAVTHGHRNTVGTQQ